MVQGADPEQAEGGAGGSLLRLQALPQRGHGQPWHCCPHQGLPRTLRHCGTLCRLACHYIPEYVAALAGQFGRVDSGSKPMPALPVQQQLLRQWQLTHCLSRCVTYVSCAWLVESSPILPPCMHGLDTYKTFACQVTGAAFFSASHESQYCRSSAVYRCQCHFVSEDLCLHLAVHVCFVVSCSSLLLSSVGHQGCKGDSCFASLL